MNGTTEEEGERGLQPFPLPGLGQSGGRLCTSLQKDLIFLLAQRRTDRMVVHVANSENIESFYFDRE